MLHSDSFDWSYSDGGKLVELSVLDYGYGNHDNFFRKAHRNVHRNFVIELKLPTLQIYIFCFINHFKSSLQESSICWQPRCFGRPTRSCTWTYIYYNTIDTPPHSAYINKKYHENTLNQKPSSWNSKSKVIWFMTTKVSLKAHNNLHRHFDMQSKIWLISSNKNCFLLSQ